MEKLATPADSDRFLLSIQGKISLWGKSFKADAWYSGQVILYRGRFLCLVGTPQTPWPLFYGAGSIHSQLRQREVLCTLSNIPCFGILVVKGIVLHSLCVRLGLRGYPGASWVPC